MVDKRGIFTTTSTIRIPVLLMREYASFVTLTEQEPLLSRNYIHTQKMSCVVISGTQKWQSVLFIEVSCTYMYVHVCMWAPGH